MNIEEFEQIINSIFLKTAEGKRANEADASYNGLQVGNRKQKLNHVAFSVDGSLQTFKHAKNIDADMVFVHHGIFWGVPKPITGNHLLRIKFLIKNNMSLYAMHLPLDCHPQIGNNSCMADSLKLSSSTPFGNYRSVNLGIKGILEKPQTINAIIKTLFGGEKNCLSILPFGPSVINSIAIISGSGNKYLGEAIKEEIDLFITGDASHENYHEALESGINVVSGGHYKSEIYGIRALATYIEQKTNLKTTVIDIETGL